MAAAEMVVVVSPGQEEDNAFFIIIIFKVPLIKFGGTFFVVLNCVNLKGYNCIADSIKFKHTKMRFEDLLPGHNIDLERLTNDHISELESIALDDRIWQNLPYKIKDKHSFDTFIKDR